MYNPCQTLIRRNLLNICKSSMQALPEFSKKDRPLKPTLRRPTGKVRPVWRSAGFQPAVSPISNRQNVATTGAPGTLRRPQAGSTAVQQVGNLRYDFVHGPVLPRQRAVSSAIFKILPVLINSLAQRGVNGHREASGVQGSRFKVRSSKFGSWLFSGCWMLALGCFRRSRHPRRPPSPTLLRPTPPPPMLLDPIRSSPLIHLPCHPPGLIPMRACFRLPQTLCVPKRYLNLNGKPIP